MRGLLASLWNFLLLSCASTSEHDQQRLQIAIEGLQQQIELVGPLLDDETHAYVETGSQVLDVLAAGGTVDWESVNAALDALQPAALALLEQRMDREDAVLALAGFRSALTTIRLLTSLP